MSKPADTSHQKVKCVPRRHLSNAAFKTYDAMCAMVAENAERLCWASAGKLANWNGRSPDSEREALKELEREGWIIPTHSGLRRKSDGNFTSNEYRVLTHEQFVAAHPGSCPERKYDDKTGRLLAPGRAPRPLERLNVRKIFSAAGITFAGDAPTELLDHMADRLHEKKSAITENPAPHQSAVTEKSVTEQPTVTGNSVTAVTEKSVIAVAESSVTSLDVKLEKESTTSTSTSLNEPGPKRAEEAEEDFEKEPTKEELAENERKLLEHQNREWRRFLNEVHKTDLRGAVMTAADQTAVRKQVDRDGTADVIDAVKEWARNRSMPVDAGLKRPWSAWLREGEPYLREAREKNRDRRMRVEWKKCVDTINRLGNPMPNEFKATLDPHCQEALKNNAFASYSEQWLLTLRTITWAYEYWKQGPEAYERWLNMEF